MDKLTIISSDGHAGPPVAGYREYLPAKYHDDLDLLIEEERQYLAASQVIGAFSQRQIDIIDKDRAIATGGYDGAWDLGLRLREMDREGIAAETLIQGHQHASVPFYGSQNRPRTPELRMAGARAFNRWQLDMMTEAPGRFIGLCDQTPVGDLDDVLAEIRWAGEHGFRGLVFPAISDPALGLPDYSDPYWEPMWQTVANLDMALVMHIGLGTPQGAHLDAFLARAKAMADDQEYDRMSRILVAVRWRAAAREANAEKENGKDSRVRDFFSLNYSPRMVFWQLMVAGVFDRYPSLRYVPTECRAGWIPATLAYMDARFEVGDTPLTRRPSEYWADHGFVGVSSIHHYEVEHRHEIGIQNLMFGRDFPHPEGTWPNTKDWLRAAMRGVPEDEVRQMLGTNPIRAYGLDVEAIHAITEQVGPSVSDIVGDHVVDPELVNEFDRRGGYNKVPPPLQTDRLDEFMEEALSAHSS